MLNEIETVLQSVNNEIEKERRAINDLCEVLGLEAYDPSCEDDQNIYDKDPPRLLRLYHEIVWLGSAARANVAQLKQLHEALAGPQPSADNGVRQTLQGLMSYPNGAEQMRRNIVTDDAKKEPGDTGVGDAVSFFEAYGPTRF